MSSEITIRSGLSVRSGNVNYNPGLATFRASLLGTAKGPTPGVLTVTTTGLSVSFTQLVQPGVYRIKNYDATNYVEYGILVGSVFYPIGELLPGEEYVLRFSRNLGEGDTVPGTGTTASTNSFYLRANTAPCDMLVEAFES